MIVMFCITNGANADLADFQIEQFHNSNIQHVITALKSGSSTNKSLCSCGNYMMQLKSEIDEVTRKQADELCDYILINDKIE